MAGRNAQPIDILVANGRKHLTKEEIAHRKAAEVKLGETDFAKLRAPAYVRKDKVAAGYWRQLIKEYKSAAEQGVELLTSSDVGVLARYCKTQSEYEKLLEAYQRIDRIAADPEDLEEYLDNSEQFDYRARVQMTQLLSVDGLLRIETAVNKKMDMLIKMEDRLFLNPLAKVKNIPKPKKEEKAPSKFAKFGGGRSG